MLISSLHKCFGLMHVLKTIKNKTMSRLPLGAHAFSFRVPEIKDQMVRETLKESSYSLPILLKYV